MKYLVDANVLSEPTKSSPNPHVVEWLRINEKDIVVDPIVLGELHFGILVLAKGRKRTALERWFEQGARAFPGTLTRASIGRSYSHAFEEPERQCPLKIV